MQTSVVDEAARQQQERRDSNAVSNISTTERAVKVQDLPLAPSAEPDFSHFKIPPRAVISDDCEITVGMVVEDGETIEEGTKYYPHVGETVWVLPIGNVQAYFDLGKFQSYLNGGGRDGDDLFKQISDMEDRFRRLAVSLSKSVVHWDWTDNHHEPLDQPYKNPDVIMSLETEELIWLLSAAQGETKGERKNVSEPLEPTSKGSPRRRRT